MRNGRTKKRLSLISDIIIFLIILNIGIGFYTLLYKNDNETDISALATIDIKDKIYMNISDIKELYSVDIVYGEKTRDLANNVNAAVELDDEKVFNMIEYIKLTLSKYPRDFFKKQKVTIVIFDKFNNNNIALASKNSLNEYRIYISNNDKIERSIHHEIYHIYEYMNNIKASNIFEDWNRYNPDNFEYITDISMLTNQYVYGSEMNLNDVYFATKYSKTSEKEDRAEIFAEIMTYDTHLEYLTKGSKIYNKASYITDVMNNKLNSKNTGYWDKYKER